MLQIAICDDDNIALLQIKQIIEEFKTSHSSKYNIQCHAFSSSLDLIMQTENGANYDILILDVVMPVLTGIEVATEIRMRNNLSKIIFLTSSREFAIDSYKVDAFYYLLKPIKPEALLSILKKACEEITDKKEKAILVKSKTSLTKIYLHNLEFMEVSGRRLFFHLTSGVVIESLGTMSNLESDLLSDKRFFKTHRSYIINMDFIQRLTDKDILTFSNQRVPLSREHYKNFKQTYINYSFEEYKNTETDQKTL